MSDRYSLITRPDLDPHIPDSASLTLDGEPFETFGHIASIRRQAENLNALHDRNAHIYLASKVSALYDALSEFTNHLPFNIENKLDEAYDLIDEVLAACGVNTDEEQEAA